jgi:hypothetical protein
VESFQGLLGRLRRRRRIKKKRMNKRMRGKTRWRSWRGKSKKRG